MKLIIFLTILSINLFASSEITQIRHLYNVIEKNSKSGFYIEKKHIKEDSDCFPMRAEIYLEKWNTNSIPRKLHCEGGSEDSAGVAEYYYRENGKIFFSFIKYANIANCWSEIRNYYDERGGLIKRLYKDSPKCGLKIDVFPDKIKDPWEGYKSFCKRW